MKPLNYKVIDLENWYRKDIFHFYKNYDDPFINLTANVDVTRLLEFSKKEGTSFFLNSLYLSIKVANAIPAFKYRLLEDQLVEYEAITAGSAILNPDNSFSFCYFDNHESRADFIQSGQEKIAATQQQKGIDPKANALNMIHYSVVPWVSFTSLKHARKYNKQDTIPKIVFGKYFENGDKVLMPLSIEVHHSMMDGYHMGLYFQKFEAACQHIS